MILLMTVSFIAMLFEFLPVLVASILSAFIWNYFFIPPVFTLHIRNPEDMLMFSTYFVVAFLNAVLTSKIRKAEKKSREKEQKVKTIRLYNTLLNSLSHELRTPISTIIGAVDTLKEGGIVSPENQLELLNQIDIASIRLNRQVENLLNMSRLESGMLQPKYDWFDVNELIHFEMEKVTKKEGQVVVNLSQEELPFFKLDAGLIEQILHNLIHNAVQYTPENSKIEVYAQHSDSSFKLTVSDNGIGFPEKEMHFAFDKFYRVPNTKTGGSGLGLSIVKGFVEAMNGTIELKNNENGGAEFTVLIPSETSYISNLKHE